MPRLGPLLVIALLATSAYAQEEDKPVTRPTPALPRLSPVGSKDSATSANETQKELLDFTQSFAEAFNKQDAKAVASHWAKEGVHTNRNTGDRTTGRDAIQKVYESLFEDASNKQLTVVLSNVRQITKDVATADGAATIVTEADDPEESTFTAVFVRQDGKWLLDTAQETDLPPADKPYNHLAALEWMVGEWHDDGEDVDINTSCKWSANYAFLIRSYSVARGGSVEHQGTQIVGWDPENEIIRSWNFESDGSYGEGTWTQDGSKWTVKLKGVAADGNRAAATQVIHILDENTITSQMVGREIGGQMLPSGDPVRVIRVSPQEADE